MLKKGEGARLGKEFLFVLMSQLFSCAAFHLQVKSKGISFFCDSEVNGPFLFFFFKMSKSLDSID